MSDLPAPRLPTPAPSTEALPEALPEASPAPLIDDVREADDAARRMWPNVARMGRHGFAVGATTTVVAGTVIALMAAHVIPLWWLVEGPEGDLYPWMLVLGVPTVAALYNLCLARYDQDAARFGGGRVTLDAWRETPPERPAGEADAPTRGDA